jgi:PPK2 family polyphosphate:nucleotide phosphotransferase
MATSGKSSKAAKSAASRKSARGTASKPATKPATKKDRVRAKAAKAEQKSRRKVEKPVEPPSPLGSETAVADPDLSMRQLLRVERGFVLADVDCDATPGFDGGKSKGGKALLKHADELGEWQERLWAETKAGAKRSVLLVVQGMDTSGKGGIMRHVFGHIDPEGIQSRAFKAPDAEERRHDFLWRIRRALPTPGHLGIFDRSHYEDVLIVRVHDLVPRAEWSKRYALINAFEREAIASGIRIVKVMTHISRDEQKARLRRRLERPDKHYKYHSSDVDERMHWDEYMAAYQAVLDKTSTKGAPWYVVPANKKWYARYAVQQLLLETLAEMDPTWPDMGLDVEAELKRLDAS